MPNVIKKPRKVRSAGVPTNPEGGTPPVAHRFQKGKSGNPGGRKRIPPDIERARHLTQVELERAINHYFFMDRIELKAALSDEKTPVLELIVGTIMAKAITAGDHQRLEFILGRMLPKLKERLEITIPGGVGLVAMTQEQRVAEIDRLRNLRELAGND